ncbi:MULTISPECIES: Gfo/Idh/MocA family oxidoreductase [unclassified Legionella]|uniref:Gfo/Idh/MocA family oxidoreductase n=1 Tax=unclassified Legionella TaxID=2622702 RepID=UPI001055A994|nr:MULTISPECIES: Gfo/Idh/MocA family oxidoreductase [unclassified Legionella]MDI9817761.1 Gfo/Idh/MocA family oxidoreductase [Legionella sp. PL877]
MNKIAIIGAGQLGSRHLQALNLINKKLNITVIDPNPESLELACSRFDSCKGDSSHEIAYQQSIDINNPLDIVIVASTAQSRRAIVEKLLSNADVNHLILEKLLFTQYQDYIDIAEILAVKKTKTWVNCPMRMMPFYKTLNQLFLNQAIHYRVTGSQYGLVTNAIHYLDHITYITGNTEFELDTSYLDKEIIASKRPGYYELTGTLIARFRNGSIAFLHCDKHGMSPTQIEIYSNDNRIISREWEQKAWATSISNDWQWQEQAAPVPFQSSLTAELVSSLLEDNNCQLTDYQTSMKIHLQLLTPLQLFLNECGVKGNVDYPFT